MNPQCALSLAVAAAFTVGGLFSLLAFDTIIYWLMGHTATVSHGAWALGERFRWLPWAWTAAGVGLTLFLRVHFWGR